MTLKKKKKKILTHSLHIPSKYNQQNNLNKFHIYKKPKKKSLPIGSSIQCKLWLFQKKIKKKKKTILYQYIYIYIVVATVYFKKKIWIVKKESSLPPNHASTTALASLLYSQIQTILVPPLGLSLSRPALWVMVSLSISPSLFFFFFLKAYLSLSDCAVRVYFCCVFYIRCTKLMISKW